MMSKNRIVWWIVLAGLVVLALVAGGVYWIATSNTETESKNSPSSPESPDGGEGASGPSGYEIEAGSGGTKKAKADDRTPIGYDWQCPAAVQAATNYYSFALSGTENFAMDKGEWDALIDEINGGLDGGLGPMEDLKSKQEKDDFWPDGEHDDMKLEAHSEQGLFRVVGCDDGGEATVDVVSAMTWPAEKDEAMYSGARLYLTWSDNDWRLVDVDEEPVDDAFIDASERSEKSFDLDAPPYPVTSQWRSEAIELLGPAWQEYSNAPQYYEVASCYPDSADRSGGRSGVVGRRRGTCYRGHVYQC